MSDSREDSVPTARINVPKDELSDVPTGFRDAVIRTQSRLNRDKSGVRSSIPPEHISESVERLLNSTQQLPTEVLSYKGKRVELTDGGQLKYGPPTDDSHFEVLKILGRGGMGVVCAVRQRALQRDVAVKIARTAGVMFDSDEAPNVEDLELFLNEALVTADLDHPNVVPVHTLAKDPTNRLFFTMKQVTGLSWEDLLDPAGEKDPDKRRNLEQQAAKLSFNDHLDILLKVCDAVAYAHSKNILHRDLKPDNVMIGKYGEVLLMDWGLAMTFGDKNPYVLNPDKEAQLVGTPAYFAPEMARGEMTRFGPATDIYLLGGILYRILTDKPPHQSDDFMKTVNKAAAGKVDPPERVSSSLRITPEISRITMKALAPGIEERYSSVEDFQRDLRQYRAHAESLAVAVNAAKMYQLLNSRVCQEGGHEHSLRKLGKGEAAVAYGGLSECIGAFRQSIELWAGNQRAHDGLLAAFVLQIRLAMQQGDLTMARSHLEMMPGLVSADADPEWTGKVGDRQAELTEELNRLLRGQAAALRRVKMYRYLVAAVVLLIITGVAGAFALISRQKELAEENLRRTEHMQQRLFAQAVTARAALVSRYMFDLEHTVSQYRDEAVRLMSLSDDLVPPRPTTAAGRDGYYLDEDYYDPDLRPAGMQVDERYRRAMSMEHVTIKLAPWATREPALQRALQDARRLSRLNTLFAHVHRARDDITWSLAGTDNGILVAFPGSGRYREKPEYDPTRRPWYTRFIMAQDPRPRWGDPYIDAAGQGVLITCASPVTVNGTNVGVIGLEVSVENIQHMLLEFTQAAGSGARGLLVRRDGLVVIDTRYETHSTEWQRKFELIRIEDAGSELNAYFQKAVSGKADSASGQPTRTSEGDKLVSHAWLSHQDWMLIVVIDRSTVTRTIR